MSPLHPAEMARIAGAIVLLLVLALLPLWDTGYYLSMGVNILIYVVLCTAWALFSGPTKLVSLATAALYGVGTYTVALGIDHLPLWLLVPLGGVVAAAIAGLVGAATLRLSGVYFVIFTLGLAELIRQLVTWGQTKMGKVGLYVFTDLNESRIYWLLLGLAGLVFLAGWLIGRARLGMALRVIGDDETVARHAGIPVARVKVMLFMISGAFMGMAGAILAPRYAYIEPQSAFNAMTSFLVVTMVLLGGTGRLWGPLVGVIPFTLAMDFIGARFPDQMPIVVGLVFLVIVFLLPNGVTGRLEQLAARLRRRNAPAPVGEQL